MAVETITTLISSFFEGYYQLLLPLFSVGISYLLGGTYSNMSIIFSVLMLFNYFIFGTVLFLALGVIGAIVFFVLKNSGM